jgi:hypothetical protein
VAVTGLIIQPGGRHSCVLRCMALLKAKNYRLVVQPKEGAADQLVRTGQQNDK